MRAMRKNRRVIAAVALWGVLAMAFAPLLSHAFGLGTGYAALGEICTAQGAKTPLPLADGRAPISDDRHAAPFGHCPFCVSHVSVAPPPQTPAVTPARREARGAPSATSCFAPRPSIAWAHARPRAPPVTT